MHPPPAGAVAAEEVEEAAVVVVEAEEVVAEAAGAAVEGVLLLPHPLQAEAEVAAAVGRLLPLPHRQLRERDERGVEERPHRRI